MNDDFLLNEGSISSMQQSSIAQKQQSGFSFKFFSLQQDFLNKIRAHYCRPLSEL